MKKNSLQAYRIACVGYVLIMLLLLSGLTFAKNGPVDDHGPTTNTTQQEQTREAEEGVTLSGVVISAEDDLPLPGVNVVEEGTVNGTITDVNGKYSLEVKDAASKVTFSSVGYVQEKVTEGVRTVIDMVLMHDIMSLKEVVVVDYGVQKKESVVGAVRASGKIPSLGNQYKDVEMRLTLREGGVVSVDCVAGAQCAVQADGASTFNQADRLEDRELSLNYKVTIDGDVHRVSATLLFRNRIRDEVNEWQGFGATVRD